MTAMRPTRRNRCRSRRKPPPFPSDQPMSRPARPLPGGRAPRGCPQPCHHEETTMPNDTEFTLSLFDNTALSGWNHHALQAVAEPDEADEADADDDADAGRRHAAACGRSGRARQQLPSHRRPRACPRLAGAGARQHRRDHPVEGRWNSRAAPRPRTSRRNCCASSASARRSWRRTASAAPARTNSARLAGDRRGARSRRHAGGIRRAATRHAICPLHAGDDHPWTLARRRTAGL